MKKLSLFLIIFFIVLFIGELVLQRKYTPGYQTHYSDFKIVDSLIVYEDYETDIFGNYILGSLIRDSVKSIYDYNNCSIANKQIENKIANADGIKKILEDFCKLKNILIPNNEFEFFSSSLLKQSKLDKSDSACLAYLNYPFNQEGFRSIEFDNYKSNKIKVLLIGDSFVWGMTAKPYYNSFADILLARNYQVFNAGIASVDPIQYWGICKNYFDKIDPDLVIVNFFEGNDLITKERIYGENLPHEHLTNAGFFESNPNGKYLDAYEAYNYYKYKLKIPTESYIDKALSKTAIGSIVWTKLFSNKQIVFSETLSIEESIKYTNSFCDSIYHFLEEKSCPLIFSIIPNVNACHNETQNRLSCDSSLIDLIFNNLKYYTPLDLTPQDYNIPKDYHFNNSGSLKYANFIDSLIQQKLSLE